MAKPEQGAGIVASRLARNRKAGEPISSAERQIHPLEDERGRQQLERRIGFLLPDTRLGLAITDNCRTVVSVRRDPGPLYRVRLHHMFLDAPAGVVAALAGYITISEPKASRMLDAYIDAHSSQIRTNRRSHRRPPVTVQTRGQVFDLQQVFDELNRRYFCHGIVARITWGTRQRARRRRSSIKMGSYAVEDRLIRIHPALDRSFVPHYFLEWIIYHEMLHQIHEMPVVAGRRRFHTSAFLAQERTFSHFEQAQQWERENLDRILDF
ncbi:MAG: hypothetical protein V2A73_01610 [Pseudomonadota bacterium]